MMLKLAIQICRICILFPLALMASCSNRSAANVPVRSQISKGRFVQVGEGVASLVSRIGAPNVVCVDVQTRMSAGADPREALVLVGRDEYSKQPTDSAAGYYVYFDHNMARMCLNAARSDPIFSVRQVCFLGSVAEFVVVSVSDGAVKGVTIEYADFVLFDAVAIPVSGQE
jgi:hypothetical protein